MRTTVSLDDDVVKAVEQIRRETGAGVSEALNVLARMGMSERRKREKAPFSPVTADLGLRLDVANIGDVLELLDETP